LANAALDLDYQPPGGEKDSEVIQSKAREMHENCAHTGAQVKIREDERVAKKKERTTKKVEGVAQLAPEKWLETAIDQRLESWDMKPKAKAKAAKEKPSQSPVASEIFVQPTAGTLELVAKIGDSRAKGGGKNSFKPVASQGHSRQPYGKGKDEG
jgi:hypothetical protein